MNRLRRIILLLSVALRPVVQLHARLARASIHVDDKVCIGREQRHLALRVSPVGTVRVSVDQFADRNAIGSLFRGH
jgi:hypothetical protein